MLIEKLSDIQTSLPLEYRNGKILLDKLPNALRDVESCRLAYHKTASMIQGGISALHASLETENSVTKTTDETAILFVDCRYIRKRKSVKYDRSKKCFVCSRPGCWSTHHSTKKGLKALLNNKTVCQFLVEIDSDDESIEEKREILDKFQDMISHTIDIGAGEDTNDNEYD